MVACKNPDSSRDAEDSSSEIKADLFSVYIPGTSVLRAAYTRCEEEETKLARNKIMKLQLVFSFSK